MSIKKRRKNGEGNWGERVINGINYKYFRKYYEIIKSEKTFYGKTDKEVIKKRNDFENSIKEYQIIDKKSDVQKMCFGDYALHWIRNIKPFDGSDTSQQTIDSYELIITTKRISKELYNTQISSLNQEIFNSYVNEYLLKEMKYARSTIKRTMCVVKQVCNNLLENNQIGINFAERVKLPSEKNVITKKKDIKFLEENDMEKLYKEFLKEDSNGKKIYGINSYAIIFIMYTGLRISECISLKWEDINEELNIITISHSIIVLKDRDRKDGKTKYITKDTKDAKTKSSNRSIPLSERAKEILNELKKINSICDKKDYIFINKNGNLMNKRNVLRTLNKMQKNAKCEVEKCGLHALRHSFGSYLILHGTDIKTVSELLGHADIQITLNIYIHIINIQ